MRKLHFEFTLCSVLILGGGASAGTVSGTVRMPPGIDGRRSPAVVYFQGEPTNERPGPETVVVDQVNREFVPRVQAMALG